MTAASLAPAVLEQNVAVAVLLAARLLPLALLVPWLAIPRAPLSLSLAVTAVLVLCLQAPAAAAAPQLPFAAATLAALALQELLLGLVYALPLALPLYAIEWSGVLSGRALSPAAERALSSLLLALAAASFFALGGHRVVLRVLAVELGRVPVGRVHAPADPTALVIGAAGLLGEAFALALLLALPVLAAVLLAELGVALAARGSGASNLHFVWPPLRPAIVLAASWIGVALLAQTLPTVFEQSLRAARGLWGSL